MSVAEGIFEGRHVTIVEVEVKGLVVRYPNRVVAGAPGKGYVDRRADEEVRKEGDID
jgi:hypothetical protein